MPNAKPKGIPVKACGESDSEEPFLQPKRRKTNTNLKITSDSKKPKARANKQTANKGQADFKQCEPQVASAPQASAAMEEAGANRRSGKAKHAATKRKPEAAKKATVKKPAKAKGKAGRRSLSLFVSMFSTV